MIKSVLPYDWRTRSAQLGSPVGSPELEMAMIGDDDDDDDDEGVRFDKLAAEIDHDPSRFPQVRP